MAGAPKWLLLLWTCKLRAIPASVEEQSSDVARPLSYKTKITYLFKTKTKTGQAKTKTTFSKPRPLF